MKKLFLVIVFCAAGLSLGTLTAQAQSISYNHDGSKFCIAYYDDTRHDISLYDALSRKKLWTSSEYPFRDFGTNITFSSDSQKIFLVLASYEYYYEYSGNMEIPIILDARTGRTLQRINLSTRQAVFSLDGTQIAYIRKDNVVVLYDVASGRDIKRLYTFISEKDPNTYWLLEDGTRTGTRMGWSPPKQEIIGFTADGKRIIVRDGKSFDEDAAFYVIDINSGSVLLKQNVEPDTETTYNTLLGRIIVSEDRNYENIKILDVTSAQILAKIKKNGFASQYSYSENGKRIACIFREHNGSSIISVWDAETGILRYNLPHTDELTAIALHPDGSKIIALSRDGNIVLWDISQPALGGGTRR